MSRARDNANLGAQAGSGLDASDLTTGALPVGVTGGSGLNALSASNLSAGTVPDARMPNLTGDITTVEGAVATTIAASVIGVKPHIIPDVLYPSSGNDLAGDALVATTDGPNDSIVASSKYGTVQASDGRMYYYTDIKGSKPIKDPRIGAHFGSQRHTLDSLQLLEQETATHGSNVYSVDGREWCRGAGNVGWVNDSNDNRITLKDTATTTFLEVTGFFSDVNFLHYSHSDKSIRYTLDGATENSTDFGATSSAASPLGGRYVSVGSIVNLGLGASLGIHTIKFRRTGSSNNLEFYGIELIAQDTTSTTTKSQIQIPSQNVVSYGKKFTVSGTPHYDPFNGFTNGDPSTTTPHSAVVDTATSLGLSAWYSEGYYHSVYYRPYNGGRVVKWVDSSGTIKTSVNMMPFNATSISNSNINKKENASATNNDPTPSFIAGAIDHSQAEVAKTFHWREFGNGNANGGASGTYKDASMTHETFIDIAYVMDDGLTSLCADEFKYNSGEDANLADGGASMYITFIGTGFSGTHDAIVQNLPYGTHIIKFGASPDPLNELVCDGVQIHTNFNIMNSSGDEAGRWVNFYQPKMPPIPEDAVVLADYMLMADFVAQGAVGIEKISKGVRLTSCSRDVLYDASTPNFTHYLNVGSSLGGFQTDSNVSAGVEFKLPFFGNGIQYYWSNSATYSMVNADMTIDGSAASTGNFSGLTASTPSGSYNSSTGVLTPTSGTRYGEVLSLTGLGLGQQTFQAASASDPSGNNRFRIDAFSVETPIHTSSHYQTFETPFLHELVGGDRNMEQTNLVVTPDGKTWDEVTRDVSYMSPNLCVSNITASGNFIWDVVIFDEHRGYRPSERRIDCYFKDFAYGYDRFICLVDGQYEFFFHTYTGSGSEDHYIKINGEPISRAYTSPAQMYGYNVSMRAMGNLKRGDYVQLFGGHFASNDDLHTGFFITRLGER